ncbi:MAG: Hydrogenase isoenzymes formation protein HypC [Candidatus Dichloromethanomonas elyunquensis]|nr:MAG: Hydrogenase isoenzymes formation protein HypC [Candidatus Dichloromethanomonas elyunquensis]
MCLAVPGKIVKIKDRQIADVDYGSLMREVSLRLIPEAGVGDWVLVHAGFAIQVLDEGVAKETLSIFEELLQREEFECGKFE